MEHLFDQIRGTLDAGFPYAAIALALSIPDVCANLSVDDKTKDSGQKSRYMRWFSDHAVSKITVLTAEDT
jgi:hypothetical protein